jgi:hypothetical protein
VTTEYLEADDWIVRDVGLVEPFDLDCMRGAARLHVEVKGTRGLGEAVTLTAGEVSHARDFADVALAIVSGIRVDINDLGEPSASDGELTFWCPWNVDAGVLEPTVFRYSPP